MDVETLKMLRKQTGLNQTEFGKEVGLSYRQYSDIERGTANLNQIHINAVHFALLRIAVERKDLKLVPPEIADLARDYSDLMQND